MASSRLPRKLIINDNETKPLSMVQQRARQFEALATLQVKSKECNWWLSDFKNPCECEPCENSKSTDDGVIDSQKNVVVRENIYVPKINIVEESEVIEQNELITDEDVSAGGRVSVSEDEKIATDNENDADFVLVNSPVSEQVVEAMNDNINFKVFPNIHHGVTLAHSNDTEVHMTDED